MSENSSNAVLKFRKDDASKYQLISNLVLVNGKFGPFYTNDIAKDKRDSEVQYLIVDAMKKGPKMPERLLKVKTPGEEKAKILTGLFKKKYEDGSVTWQGKDRESGIKYLFAINEQKANASAVSDAADGADVNG